MIKRIDHINIVVSNLGHATQFFRKLGFDASAPAELSGEWISSIVGLPEVQAHYVVLTHSGSSANIELLEYHQPRSNKDPQTGIPNQIGFRHLAFEVDDIEQEVAELKKNGIQLLSEIQIYKRTGKKLVYFFGPDGILLEMAEYPREA